MRESDSGLLDEFVDALWLADGLAKNTLGAYRSDLALFADWLADRGRALTSVTGEEINGYLAYLHGRPGGIKPASQRRLHSAWRRFFHWLLEQGRITVDPLRDVARPARGSAAVHHAGRCAVRAQGEADRLGRRRPRPSVSRGRQCKVVPADFQPADRDAGGRLSRAAAPGLVRDRRRRNRRSGESGVQTKIKRDLPTWIML